MAPSCWLQWVHSPITVVMIIEPWVHYGYTHGLQWVHSPITVVMVARL